MLTCVCTYYRMCSVDNFTVCSYMYSPQNLLRVLYAYMCTYYRMCSVDNLCQRRSYVLWKVPNKALSLSRARARSLSLSPPLSLSLPPPLAPHSQASCYGKFLIKLPLSRARSLSRARALSPPPPPPRTSFTAATALNSFQGISHRWSRNFPMNASSSSFS